MFLTPQITSAALSAMDNEISKIRFLVTEIEHEPDDKIAAFEKLIGRAEKLITRTQTEQSPTFGRQSYFPPKQNIKA